MKLDFPLLGKPQAVSSSDWRDWKWQMRSLNGFAASGGGPESRRISYQKPGFRHGATAYYARLVKKNPRSGLRHIIAPSPLEEKGAKIDAARQSLQDPLAEERHSPAPRVIHRYPDRALFLVTDTCGVYCRYCTRKRWTGKGHALINKPDYRLALDYLSRNKGIREVILSGGDPLTLSDQRIEQILKSLREIPHIEIIRIASRMPVACPMRLTPALLRAVKKFHPVFLLTHFNHPKELTGEAAQALKRAANSGIPLFNQTVLLNGINNHPALIQALSRRLLFLRVKPYYMFQCDPSEGTEHLRTTVENSLWIQRRLWGRLSGLAMPALSLDIPGGGGKAGLVPDFLQAKGGGKFAFKGFDGVKGEYINPPSAGLKPPPDIEDYRGEWDDITAGGPSYKTGAPAAG